MAAGSPHKDLVRWVTAASGSRPPACSAEFFVEVGAIVSQELLDNACLAHARCAIDDQAGHAIARRIVNEIHQAFQDALSARILNPTLLAEPVNALGIGQQRRFTARGLEMAQFVDRHSDSQISTG